MATMATIDMGRKEGAAVPLSVGAGSPSNNVVSAEAYLPTKRHLDQSSHLATTDMDRKWGAVPLGEESWVPI